MDDVVDVILGLRNTLRGGEGSGGERGWKGERGGGVNGGVNVGESVRGEGGRGKRTKARKR